MAGQTIGGGQKASGPKKSESPVDRLGLSAAPIDFRAVDGVKNAADSLFLLCVSHVLCQNKFSCYAAVGFDSSFDGDELTTRRPLLAFPDLSHRLSSLFEHEWLVLSLANLTHFLLPIYHVFLTLNPLLMLECAMLPRSSKVGGRPRPPIPDHLMPSLLLP